MKTKNLKAIGLSLFVALCASGSFATEKTALAEASAPAALTQPAPEKAENNAAMQNPNTVNINTAAAAEIQDKLVGIGAKKAQMIVDYRTQNGNFTSIEQLADVSGIGKATLDKNRDRIILQ